MFLITFSYSHISSLSAQARRSVLMQYSAKKQTKKVVYNKKYTCLRRVLPAFGKGRRTASETFASGRCPDPPSPVAGKGTTVPFPFDKGDPCHCVKGQAVVFSPRTGENLHRQVCSPDYVPAPFCLCGSKFRLHGIYFRIPEITFAFKYDNSDSCRTKQRI